MFIGSVDRKIKKFLIQNADAIKGRDIVVGPSGKFCFTSKRRAKLAIVFQAFKEAYVYKCPHCHYWHLSTVDPKANKHREEHVQKEKQA